MEDEKIKKYKENNIKLYPFYKMLSWDLLFYYAIYFLFLNQVKHIETSQILFVTSFYPIFKFLLQVPCTYLISKMGKRNSLILGNVSICISILLLIIAPDAKIVILSDLFSAFGFIIKSISETAILYDSIPRSSERGNKFSKVEGRGNALYYYIDAITSIITGFLFIINGYLPMIICLIICILSTFISIKFKEVSLSNVLDEQKNTQNVKEYLKDLKYSFRYFLSSDRLKCLILYSGILYGLISVLIILRSSLLTEINIPEQYFGIIFAIMGILSGIAANRANLLHNKFKNKTLTCFAIPFSISCIIIGLADLFNLSFILKLSIILLMFAIQFAIKGPFLILIKRYFSNFATSNVRTKIYTLNNFIESLFRTAISLFASFILSIANTSYALVIIGCIFTLIFLYLLKYMKTRVGLKPEQYSKREIEFLEIN